MTTEEMVMYDMMVELGVATSEELNLARNLVSGSWKEVLTQVLDIRTGYKSIEQMLEEEEQRQGRSVLAKAERRAQSDASARLTRHTKNVIINTTTEKEGKIMLNYQVTLTSTTGQYKAVSTIVKAEKITTKEEKQRVINKGIIKIAQQRRWTNTDLKKFGYTKVKIREYDKAKIDKQNAERYEKLKQEKYACGEWKAPKRKERY